MAPSEEPTPGSVVIPGLWRQVFDEARARRVAVVGRIPTHRDDPCVLGSEGAHLSPEGRRGFAAECMLLTELMNRGRALHIGPEKILDRWHGPAGGRRDFSVGGIAIEVRSTSYLTRRHHINSLEQLDADYESQAVFSYSVGLRHGPGAQVYLPDFIQAARNLLVNNNGELVAGAQASFDQKMTQVGYELGHTSLYNSGPGILQRSNLPPRLFHVDDLDWLRLDSFKNKQILSMDLNVSYDLEIQSEALSREEMDTVLDSLMVE